MQIDESRRDQFAARVHHTLRALGCDSRIDQFDLAEPNADVAFAREILAWIDHVRIANQQIKFIVGTHRRKWRTGHGCERRECDARLDEMTTRSVIHDASLAIG